MKVSFRSSLAKDCLQLRLQACLTTRIPTRQCALTPVLRVSPLFQDEPAIDFGRQMAGRSSSCQDIHASFLRPTLRSSCADEYPLLARIGALGKESINLSAVTDMTRLDSDRRHSPRLVGAKLAHQKAYRLRVVDPKVRRYARCRHFLSSFPLKGIAPQTKSNASIAFMPRKVNGALLRNWRKRAENAAKIATPPLIARQM